MSQCLIHDHLHMVN